MRSVPGAVATGSQTTRRSRSQNSDPVATAPGTDSLCNQKVGFTMDLGLKDRVALVAAASRGIGYAAARELAREGARVFLCSRDESRASAAAQKIHEETGADVAGIAADVIDGAQTESFVSLALERAGRVDICVTNAGGPPATTFADTNLDMFRHAFEQNALSAIRFAKLVLPGMQAQGWGRIINITSVSVKQPIEGLLLSNTVRAGLTGWAKTVSAEVAADGITVNNGAGLHLDREAGATSRSAQQSFGQIKDGNNRVVGDPGPDASNGETGGDRRRHSLPGFRARVLHHRSNSASGRWLGAKFVMSGLRILRYNAGDAVPGKPCNSKYICREDACFRPEGDN